MTVQATATRLVTMQSIFAFLAALALACGAAGSAGAKRPNILFILTDDQGWPTLGCHGGRVVPTPNLDRLAAEGARFADAYATSQCTPTRATLLTGRYTRPILHQSNLLSISRKIA